MNIYGTPKEREAFKLVIVCIIAALCAWAAFGIARVFSSPFSEATAATGKSAVAGFYVREVKWVNRN